MRKSIIIFLFIVAPITLLAQWTGTGQDASNAFYGVINTANPMPSWNTTNFPSGFVYVGRNSTGQYDLTIADGGSLTISGGITIRFCTTSSDLLITGSGVLSAVGSVSNMITFTKNINDTWGHISFEGSTGNSILSFCIIEYGLKTGAGSEGYGGGIHANTNSLTISDCTIRNNKATWGGGIFVNDSRYPSISRCYIHNNESAKAGGGAYFWNYSSSIVENCIFESNASKEPSNENYSGGGLCAQSYTSIKVINCTFINNTTTRANGAGIELHVSSNARIVNTIVWGSTSNQVFLNGSFSSTLINNAFVGLIPVGSINCISLNTSNSAADGPRFVNPGTSDWAISFNSPCFESGVNSYTGVTIPPSDYLNAPTRNTKDIGAFEMQNFNGWKTNASSSDWNTGSNWDFGVPTSSQNILIPSGAIIYPSGTSFTIGAGYGLVVSPGANLTLDELTNNGTLKLNSAYPYINVPASLIVNTYTKGGGATEEIQLPLEGGGKKSPVTYKWHYISSPVTTLPVSTFAPTYTLNVAQWVENRPITSLTQGWVAYDGYIYSTGGMGGETFSNLTPGKGYNYFDTEDNIFTFSGQLNTGDVNATLSYTTGDDLLYGYNLIGNPFSSGLDWDYIITHSFPTNTTKSLYFTRFSSLCTYINGVGVPGDVTGIIPPMQGFFSKTYSTGNTIVLAAAARTHNNIHPTYKGSKSQIPLVRLALTDDTLSDEMVVRFDDNAKSYLDNDFDAVKLFMDPDLSTIYSSLGGTDYAINGLPFPETLLEVPVNVNLVTEATSKTITASQLQGLENYTVTLTDLSTGFIANLKTTPSVTFAAAKGTITDRFILKVSLITTDIETPAVTNNKFNIYSGNNSINIQTIADEWDGHTGDVRVLDLTGKTISDLRNTEFSKNSLTQVAAPGAKGLYVVEIRAGVMRYVGKVVVR